MQGFFCRRTKLQTLRSRVVEGRFEAESSFYFFFACCDFRWIRPEVLVEDGPRRWPNPLRAAARHFQPTLP